MKTHLLAACLLMIASIHEARAQGYVAGLEAFNARDYDTALKELRPFAEQGVAGAQFYLGLMYDIGEGVPQDYAEAAKWYRMAAEQGDASAQYNLGIMYDIGEGMPQDYTTAHMWYNLAGSNGHAVGGESRGLIAAKMTPADISEAQRRARVCWESQYKDCD